MCPHLGELRGAERETCQDVQCSTFNPVIATYTEFSTNGLLLHAADVVSWHRHCFPTSMHAAGTSEPLTMRGKGLLNCLAEANVESTVEEAVALTY